MQTVLFWIELGLPCSFHTIVTVTPWAGSTSSVSMVFWPTWPSLIVKFLCNPSKITRTLWLRCCDQLHLHNVFHCFYGVMSQFELVKHKFLCSFVAFKSVYLSAPQQPRYYQPTNYISAHTKILQKFWSILIFPAKKDQQFRNKNKKTTSTSLLCYIFKPDSWNQAWFLKIFPFSTLQHFSSVYVIINQNIT